MTWFRYRPYAATVTRALLAPPLTSTIDRQSPAFVTNRADMLEQLAVIDELLDEADGGGGPAAHERLRGRGKLPIRERIANVLDPDSPFLEISPLAGYNSDYAIGGGVVVGIGVIAGIECVIFANDPTVLGGALTPYVAQEVDARARDRARQPHALRELRRVGRRRPAHRPRRRSAGRRRGRAASNTSPRPVASSTR